jgi:hypothetical protein
MVAAGPTNQGDGSGKNESSREEKVRSYLHSVRYGCAWVDLDAQSRALSGLIRGATEVRSAFCRSTPLAPWQLNLTCTQVPREVGSDEGRARKRGGCARS